VNGDGWDSEVPLGEVGERYRVSIFSGAPGAPALRVIEAAAPFAADAAARPNVLYTDAMALADFGAGGALAAAYAEIAQISDAVGPGLAAQAGLG
jgi:hypothetical protein